MCDTCQDCDSSNITLPVGQVGPTGATGATGPAGPAGGAGTPGVPGTGGAIVLHNDMEVSSLTSSIEGPFSTDKTYTMPLNTLSIDGSKLIVTGLFETSGSGTQENIGVSLFLDGSKISLTELFVVSGAADQAHQGRMSIEISRVSATSVLVSVDFNSSSKQNGWVSNSQDKQKFGTFTVANLTTSPVVLNLRGYALSGTLNCHQFEIDHIIK